MKKILPLLSFAFFFSSCPIMEDVTEESGEMRTFDIWTENNLDFDVKCSIIAYFDTYLGKGGHGEGSSDIKKEEKDKIVYFDLDDLESFSVFRKNYIHKHLSIYNVNGDTLANLSDTSFVFNDQQYWTIETNTGNEFVHCILQLTDDILELKVKS